MMKVRWHRRQRSFLHRPLTMVCIVMSVSISLVGIASARGGNDFGFARTGPLQPSQYPSSISVVVPCFNCAEFVIHAFESFERGFELLHDLINSKGLPPVDCEVVVVDDKSTDGSPSVVSRFIDPSGAYGGKACSECFWPPPRYTLLVHDENQGAGVTRNDGVAAAQGEVIFFGEADDVFYEHHIPVCWDMLRRQPNVGFAKMRMDAGRDYLEASFVAGQVPVQDLHPHWQVAIEDTSPMNLCVRKQVHHFIGGFPGGHLFHMDMEDGAYMMALFECFPGFKLLAAPSTLYVRRPGNGLDRRMRQFTHSPGTVPLIEQDEKYSDERMDLIDGTLALVRDAIVEYQATEELLVTDPVAGEGRRLHAERVERFGHAYSLLRPDLDLSSHVGGTVPGCVVLFRGCRPRALRSLLARLLYVAHVNPLTTTLFVDWVQTKACEESVNVAHMFPVRTRTLPPALSRAPLAARAAYAVQKTLQQGARGAGEAATLTLLFELDQLEARTGPGDSDHDASHGAAAGSELTERLEGVVAAAGEASREMSRVQNRAMPGEYAHMWGAGEPSFSRGAGGRRVFSYRSAVGGRVCGEVLRDKSRDRGGGEEEGLEGMSAVQGKLGCWVVAL